MTRTLSIVSIAVAALTMAAGGYFYMTRTEVLTVQSDPPATPAPAATPAPSPKPEHGDFEKRFVPKPPPTNGGKFN